MLKTTILIAALTLPVFAVDTLTTSSGKTVILNDDFTWQYASGGLGIATMKSKQSTLKPLVKRNDQTAEVVSKKNRYVIHYDPTKFVVKKQRGEKEFFFQSKDQAVFMQTIAEKNYMSPDMLTEAAIINARNASQKLDVVEKGETTLNGLPVNYVVMKAVVKNYEFTYFGCYFSSEQTGSIQLLCWTFTSMFDKRRPDIEGLISGFEVPGN